jgi:hypothetical protein
VIPPQAIEPDYWRRGAADVLCGGPSVVNACRSFYLASRRDDFTESAPGASRLNHNDIPYIRAANDNLRAKDRLSARCGDLLRRLIGLHSGSWPN